MTDSELQTVRDWCKANGVRVTQRWGGGPWTFLADSPAPLPPIGRETEADLYEAIWEHVGPWLQSVRNLDALEVPGPYKVQPWKVREGVQYYCVTNSMSFDFFADMSEQTARRIAAILNRECWDGK